MAFSSSLHHPFSLSSSSTSTSTIRETLTPNASLSFPTFSFPPVSIPQTLVTTTKPPTTATKPSPPHSSLNSTTAAITFRPPSLKSRLQNGDTLYGIFLLTFSPTIAEIAGLAGYDFAVVDMEHGHGGIADALPCLRALAAAGKAAILRLPESSAAWAMKALDIGPQGIMFPMIDGPKSARKVVSYCRFPPSGVRGSAHTIVRSSDYGIDEGFLSNYEDELLIMCQVM